MQTVAASRMRKAQELALKGRPFTELILRLLAEASQKVGDKFSHPLLENRPIKRRCVILITTDRGLCGALNANLFREVMQFDSTTTIFIAAGKKGAQFLVRTKRRLEAEFTFRETPIFRDAEAIARFVREKFIEKEVDEVLALYPKFINTLRQQPQIITLLPMAKLWSGTSEGPSEYIFEPSPEAVMDYLLKYYLSFQILQLLYETRASEHSARMIAMKNATENAMELIEQLTLLYNKARQASITAELLDNVTAQMAMM